MTLSGANTPGQSGPGSDGNKRVYRIPQSPRVTGTLQSDCLVSYAGHSLEGVSNHSAEMQLVYSTPTHSQLCKKPSLYNYSCDTI